MQELINRAKELLADGTVARVLGWKAGDLPYNPEPAYFETEESLKDFVYNGFCGANLSKYMIEASKLEGKTLVCLKPCDTYSFNQLIKEHRVDREKAYIIGVGCKGKLDIERIRKQGIKGIESISGAEITDEAETLTIQTIYGEKTCAYKDAMLERCHVCKGKEHKIYDELTVKQMKRNPLRADTAALTAVCTSSCHMECTDDMEHLLFERVHVCFLRTVKLIAVEYTFTAAACRTDITAGIAADTFA